MLHTANLLARKLFGERSTCQSKIGDSDGISAPIRLSFQVTIGVKLTVMTDWKSVDAVVTLHLTVKAAVSHKGLQPPEIPPEDFYAKQIRESGV